MRVVSFSLLVFLCVSCVSSPKIQDSKASLEPIAIPFISKANFSPLIATGQKQYWLVWSNPNPSIVHFQVESKTTVDGNWRMYISGYHWQFSETNIPIFMTNVQQYYRVGFTWP